MRNLSKIPALSVAPVRDVVEGARRFAAKSGLSTRDHWDYSRIVVDPAAVQKVGAAYMELPFITNDAPAAWKAMGEEVKRQFDFMTAPESAGGMGITVTVEETDPYDVTTPGGTRAFFDDVRNGRMRVLSTKTTGGHFMFGDDGNNMFRAVHDVFGHCGTGRGVDRHGEEAAFRKHSLMFSPLARKALATETRGQNHALIVTGEFQDNKIAVLPNWARDFRTVAPTALHTFRATLKEAARFHAHQGLATV